MAEKRIAVVGAGASGAAIAATMTDAGFDVTCIEQLVAKAAETLSSAEPMAAYSSSRSNASSRSRSRCRRRAAQTTSVAKPRCHRLRGPYQSDSPSGVIRCQVSRSSPGSSGSSGIGVTTNSE